MIETGRLCVKTAGRDAGKTCVVVDMITDKFVLIDGEVRRRRCNINHLEPLKQKIEIKKGASHEDVVSAFKKLGIVIRPKKPKKKIAKIEPLKAEKAKEVKEEKREVKPKAVKETKPEKKEAKKEIKKAEKKEKKAEKEKTAKKQVKKTKPSK